MWERDMMKIGEKYNLETIPKKLSVEVEETIRRVIPENIQYEIIEGPKMVTILKMEELFKAAQLKGTLNANTRKCTGIFSDTDVNDVVWKEVKDILNQDGFFTSFELSIDGEKVLYPLGKALKIEEPKQFKPIGAEDLMDLSIVLKQEMDVNDFINSI
jgi:hypothetical protein